MKNAVVYSIYEYDKTLFISLFCENKNRSQLKCNGKCYLAKMQKEQDKKDAADLLKQFQTEIVYYNSALPVYHLSDAPSFCAKEEPIAYYNKRYSFLFTSHPVKPPEAIVLG